MNQALETGPTTRWLGPETLVDVLLEGCEVSALADSGSQVNMITPEFVQERLPSLTTGWTGKLSPASGWTWWLTHMSLGFVIARLQVKEVAGYDKDIVFLVVPDESVFGKRVPLVIGTCTLA